MNRFKVTELGSLGYGNPDAKIGFRQIIERKNIPPDVIKCAIELIKNNECMVDVNHPDDGCIDGRRAEEIVFPSNSSETGFQLVKVEDVEKLLNHNRYKVAGGGYITGLAMQLALDPNVDTLNEDLAKVVDKLTENEIYCGLHTADCNGDELGSGCGASDKLKLILQKGQSCKDEVNGTIEAIFNQHGVAYRQDVADRADDGLITSLGHQNYFEGSNGKARFELIMNKLSEINASRNSDSSRPLSVCKGLKGEHNEIFTVINTVEGKTFSQAEFIKQIKEQFPDISDSQIPEVFVVDVPRIQKLAEVMAQGYENEEEAYQTALYAGLSFQLATAAELTDGTLENYLVQAA